LPRGGRSFQRPSAQTKNASGQSRRGGREPRPPLRVARRAKSCVDERSSAGHPQAGDGGFGRRKALAARGRCKALAASASLGRH